MACCYFTLAAAKRFPIATSSLGDCSIYWPGGRTAFYLALSRSARYSRSLISLKHAEATGPGSCPVVARRLVGQTITLAAKRIVVFSSRRQSTIEFCAISIMVWAGGPGILWRRPVCPASRIELYSSSASNAYPLHVFFNYSASLQVFMPVAAISKTTKAISRSLWPLLVIQSWRT